MQVMMRMMLALSVMMRCRPLNELPFVICDKKGGVVLGLRVVLSLGGGQYRTFFIRGLYIDFEGGSEVYMYFSFLLYISLFTSVL